MYYFLVTTNDKGKKTWYGPSLSRFTMERKRDGLDREGVVINSPTKDPRRFVQMIKGKTFEDLDDIDAATERMFKMSDGSKKNGHKDGDWKDRLLAGRR